MIAVRLKLSKKIPPPVGLAPVTVTADAVWVKAAPVTIDTSPDAPVPDVLSDRFATFVKTSLPLTRRMPLLAVRLPFKLIVSVVTSEMLPMPALIALAKRKSPARTLTAP